MRHEARNECVIVTAELTFSDIQALPKPHAARTSHRGVFIVVPCRTKCLTQGKVRKVLLKEILI